jgi:hypothetical protein
MTFLIWKILGEQAKKKATQGDLPSWLLKVIDLNSNEEF